LTIKNVNKQSGDYLAMKQLTDEQIQKILDKIPKEWIDDKYLIS
jgi:hypothetical protein